jgi:hypothetical protein
MVSKLRCTDKSRMKYLDVLAATTTAGAHAPISWDHNLAPAAVLPSPAAALDRARGPVALHVAAAALYMYGAKYPMVSRVGAGSQRLRHGREKNKGQERGTHPRWVMPQA